jgi:hypothetical protein
MGHLAHVAEPVHCRLFFCVVHSVVSGGDTADPAGAASRYLMRCVLGMQHLRLAAVRSCHQVTPPSPVLELQRLLYLVSPRIENALTVVFFSRFLFLQDLTPRDVTRFLGLSNSLLEIVCEQRQEIAGFAASLEGEQGGAVSSSRAVTLGGHSGLLGLVDRGGACFPSVCLCLCLH